MEDRLVMDTNLADFFLRAASIDEILSDKFESLAGQKSHSDKASLRLAAWCRSSASGNWSLFNKRLQRDDLSIDKVLEKFANIEVKSNIIYPQWVYDADWIRAEFLSAHCISDKATKDIDVKSFPFEHLFLNTIAHAELLVWGDIIPGVSILFSCQGKEDLRAVLMHQLTELCAPVFYELFTKFKSNIENQLSPSNSSADDLISSKQYDRFIAKMRAEGIDQLFAEKPVLLRLIASLTRQWVTVTREFIERYAADQEAIGNYLCAGAQNLIIKRIRGGLSDLHNSGHSVLIIELNNGLKIVYKPKDCRLDAAWYRLVNKLNVGDAPIHLRASKIIAQNGYGWTEFVGDPDCHDRASVQRFFERSGAWLALFHISVGADMHYENIIASGDHPIPIDIEMILQSSNPETLANTKEKKASGMAVARTTDSVLTVGMLPVFVRTTQNEIIGMGGMNQRRSMILEKEWRHLNSDAMKLEQTPRETEKDTNLPFYDGETANLADYVDSFLHGFKTYSAYIIALRDRHGAPWMFDGFSGLTTRKVVRPTRFYYALIQRIRDHRNMKDGVTWSTELDFVSRFSDWDKKIDPVWGINAYERLALSELNVPVFFYAVDTDRMSNPQGLDLCINSNPGLPKAIQRLNSFNEQELQWQCEVIKASITAVSSYRRHIDHSFDIGKMIHAEPNSQLFLNEAKAIAATLSATAMRSEGSAAWIGIDWLGDSNVSQLTTLGSDLYNGAAGISLFLAAYWKETGDQNSLDLAIEAIAGLRHDLRGANAQRVTRGLGVGGAAGLGSIVYAFAVISELISSKELLDDALLAAGLFTKELIEADKQLDVISGNAGAILGLLRLYRQCQYDWILDRAIQCGEYLLSQPRHGIFGKRSWMGTGLGVHPLNGMSHGAAGFAYALSALATATGRKDFDSVAQECVNYENSSFDRRSMNWPDFRNGVPHKDINNICQWCHGAIGVGLARLGIKIYGSLNHNLMIADVNDALQGTKIHGRKYQDSLCCGELGRIEFLTEAGKQTNNNELLMEAKYQMALVIQSAHQAGEYCFGGGAQNFHLSLFRGLAGVGYTALRQVNSRLPNVLIWE